MRTAEARGAHLTPDEILACVFPEGEGAVPVPLHLATCPPCQVKVTRFRDAHLIDKGAVAGAVEALPEVFWNAQAAAVMQAVHEVPANNIRPFPASLRQTIVRRPVLAFGSLAAALLLMTGLSFLRPAQRQQVAEIPVPTPVASAANAHDDELLLAIDDALAEELPFSNMYPEGV